MFEMDSSLDEVGSVEETILALLDFLVDPLLPFKFSSTREIISPSQEELVAKQVHAVVLLYNYYHRKRHPELEFLDFESFCKMAVALKPSFVSYLKLMQGADYTEVVDLEKQLSLTEKAIIRSCKICKNLDASNNHPAIEGWPITQIAVFLVDSKKESCCLFHSSITQGVWSAIEKDVNDSIQNSEAAMEISTGNKKKKVAKRTPKEYQTGNVASLQQLACLAVKEACGINAGDLRTLENHVVFSTSKKKTAVRLYIMQCTITKQDMEFIPINDAIESLQGPLVTKESDSWITTSVVEYFHLLPFLDKVSDWFSREKLLKASQHIECAKEDGNRNVSHKVEMLPNTEHFGAIKEVESNSGSHLELKSLHNYLDHFEKGKKVEKQNSFQLKVEKISSTSQCFEAEKEVEYDYSSHLEVKPQAKTSHHVEAVKDVENDNSFKLKVQQVLTTPHVEELKDVENYNESRLEMEPLSNTSSHLEKVMEVENYSSSHLKAVQLSKTSHHEAAKEAENSNCSTLDMEPQPNTTCHFEPVGEAENYNSSRLEVEPLPKTSHHFEADEVVESCNSSHIMEEKPLDTIQPSALVTEVTIGYHNHLEDEAPKYSSHHSEAANDLKYNNSFHRKAECPDTVVYKKRNRFQMTYNSENPGCNTSNCTMEYPRKEDEKCAIIGSLKNMDNESHVTYAPVDGKSKMLTHEDHGDNKKQMVVVEMNLETSLTEGAIVEGEVFDNLRNSHEHIINKVFSDNKISDNALPDQVGQQDHALASFNSDFEHLRKLQLVIASRDALLSQAALKVLYRKREILSQQHRCIEDKLASCDRSIQTILSGGEDNLAVKLESVIEGCDDISLRSVTTTEDRSLLILDKDIRPVVKRKRLSDANLFDHNPCQELDGICNENNWILPTYHVSALQGGYRASVTMKEIDFECSSEGALCLTPVEARNSAASKMLAKLRSMTATS